MVTIKSHEQRMNEKGEPFNALILEGELEMVQSQETGKYYATARKASIPSTFDVDACEELIGKQIPGTIEKVPSDPYEYTTEEGDTIVLEHSWEFNPEPSNVEEHVFEGQQNGAPKVNA